MKAARGAGSDLIGTVRGARSELSFGQEISRSELSPLTPPAPSRWSILSSLTLSVACRRSGFGSLTLPVPPQSPKAEPHILQKLFSTFVSAPHRSQIFRATSGA